MRNDSETEETNNPKPPQDILGTISFAQQTETLRTFDPNAAVREFIEKLPGREQQVLGGRAGLEDGKPLTLEEIGSKLGLTRERIRQIEKDSLKRLREITAPESFRKVSDLVFQFIEDRGNVAPEQQIVSSLLTERGHNEVARQSLLFVLSAGTQFSQLKESTKYHQSWYLAGLDLQFLDLLADTAVKILQEQGKPLEISHLAAELKKRLPEGEVSALSNEAIESYLVVSKKIGRNPFGELGLAAWAQIKPRDVGDKAFLVLSHLGKPEHYAKITELINKKDFDERTAHQESVHNELIKDKRFVLVGRGIYGLSEWGYQPGVVSDVISQIIKDAGRSLAKDEIIELVMKQRVVKRNTIVVGLSNKNKFRKTADNKYENVT